MIPHEESFTVHYDEGRYWGLLLEVITCTLLSCKEI